VTDVTDSAPGPSEASGVVEESAPVSRPSARRARFASLSSALALLGIAAAAAGARPAAASTVRAITVEALAAEAELVFEGRVVAVETSADDPRRLRTCVRFEPIEVLKAPPTGVPTPLRLCFSGGAGPRGARRVEGVSIPALGEHGIYFVESATRPLVNPLLGWDQGRFRVVTDPDEPEGRVTSADGRDVLAVDDGRGADPGLSNGVAQGISVGEPAGDAAGERRALRRALSPALFKQRLRSLLPAAP